MGENDLGLGKLLHQPNEMEKNEAAARETITMLERALNQYASRFPEWAIPSISAFDYSGRRREYLRGTGTAP